MRTGVAAALGHRSLPYRLTAFLLLLAMLAYVPLSAQPLTPVAPSLPAAADSTRVDSVAAVEDVKPVLRADTARVAMHRHNHRQQIITGGAIMATLIGVMVVMNNYNPRVPPQ